MFNKKEIKPRDRVLIYLKLFRDISKKNEFSIYEVHSIISMIPDLKSYYHPISNPFPYSAKLSMRDLEYLKAKGYIRKYPIFDDGHRPRTVYRFTTLGEGVVMKKFQSLPSEQQEKIKDFIKLKSNEILCPVFTTETANIV